MEGLPRPSKPMENRMSKTTEQILSQSYGLIDETDYTFGEALDYFGDEVAKAAKQPVDDQQRIFDASEFMVTLRSHFSENDWGKFLKGTSIWEALVLRFGKANAMPEASKMLLIGAVPKEHREGFLERGRDVNRKARGRKNKKLFFRCDSTSPTGLVAGLKRYLVEVVGLDPEGQEFIKSAPLTANARAKLVKALEEPKQSDQSETDAPAQSKTEEKPVASDPKDQVEAKPQTESTTPVQPKAEGDNKPTAEAVVEQLASQVEAYGFDSKDIENVLRLLTERLQPKAEKVVETVAKGNAKKAASKKQTTKKAA